MRPSIIDASASPLPNVFLPLCKQFVDRRSVRMLPTSEPSLRECPPHNPDKIQRAYVSSPLIVRVFCSALCFHSQVVVLESLGQLLNLRPGFRLLSCGLLAERNLRHDQE